MYKMIKQYICDYCGNHIKAKTYKRYNKMSRQCLAKFKAESNQKLQDQQLLDLMQQTQVNFKYS
jgi:uncharacterized protein YlaI